jgi:predicted GNAT family acetyltransferase
MLRETEDSMTDDVRDNAAEDRFELEVEGHLAVAYYRLSPGLVTFTHTEVPPALGGRGVGSRLIAGALENVRVRGLKVAAKCEFVAAYLGKHKEYGDLIA